jgi:hypothetical protein
MEIENVKKDSVYNIINRNIINLLKEGILPTEVISTLELRSKNMFKALESQNIDLSPLLDVMLGKKDIDDVDIIKRAKYIYLYITFCNKRIMDLNWIMNKKDELGYSYDKIFNLLLFKEKLLSDAKPVVIDTDFKVF